ncbi:MAG: DUF4838 domain-containing protein [Armatimonadota bacterium]|nr:DUF4838 domain-containing protein [Armatimonadota bacterium]
MRITAVLLTIVLSAGVCAAQFTVLDADTQAVIVHERQPQGETVKAYQDLAKYLELSTGREFTVVEEGEYDPGQGPPIYVGMCGPVKRALGMQRYGMDRDAYAVIVGEDAVMLAGAAPWSTFWAVCQFLEDHVGVRWLIPGPLGEDVPEHDSITVPVGRETYSPAILSRLWSGAHYGGDWSLRQRIHGRYHFHHNLLRVFPPELFDEHPEYFPVHGDRRYRPGPDDHSWQPCMTDPGGVAHAADAAREYFAQHPMAESFSYGINDGHGYCECEQCRKVDRPLPQWHGFSGDKSILYYTWLNRVAENLERDHPDKMLGCLAYSAVILPPTGMKLHRNIIPYLTSNRADYWDPAFRRQDQTMLARWSRTTNQMGIYDYAYGMGFAIPRIFNHLFQDAIQFAVDHGVKGFYAEVYPNWGLDGHKLYVMSRILWNPDVEIQPIVEDWNARMFREAAEPMSEYFALCERTWRENNVGHGHWAFRLAADPRQFEIFPPEVIEQCTAYLDQAADMAESQIVRDRIAFFRKTWDVTVLLAGNYWASREVEELIEEGAPLEDVAAAMRRMAERMSAVDIDAYMEERVGDDPVAFHPPKPSWIAPLKSGSATIAKRWVASQIAGDVIEEVRGAGRVDAQAMRQAISEAITDIFGTGGPERYQQVVADIRRMATKVGTAARVEEPPAVDGDLDDAAWERADVLTDFIKWGQAAQAEYTTRVRLLHDDANLYVALECEQDTSDLVTNASPRDGSTWKDDSVEIFISPEAGEPEYVQFIINAAGAFFDQWRHEDQSYAEALDYDFDAQWQAAVREGMWVAEMRLPLAEMHIDPDERTLLPMNFVRNVQGTGGGISSWFPSIKAHADPMSRGWVVLQ